MFQWWGRERAAVYEGMKNRKGLEKWSTDYYIWYVRIRTGRHHLSRLL